jgi:hypothetical protein
VLMVVLVGVAEEEEVEVEEVEVEEVVGEHSPIF